MMGFIVTFSQMRITYLIVSNPLTSRDSHSNNAVLLIHSLLPSRLPFFLEFLKSSDPPASASRVAMMASVHHCAQLQEDGFHMPFKGLQETQIQ